MSNKTIKAISINPTLFSVGAIKTKKNREKKAVVKPLKPLINPNVLKNKLLKRSIFIENFPILCYATVCAHITFPC